MTEVPINQKEYLKKYLGIGKAPGEKKKKKKKNIGSRVQIIDDDADVNFPSNVIVEDLTVDEYAPQIVAIIDERPPSLRIDEKTQNPLWQPIGTVETNNKTEQKQMIKGFKIAPKVSDTQFPLPDRSPPRRKKKVKDSESSPPRNFKRDSPSVNDVVIKEERRSVSRDEDYSSTYNDKSPIRKNRKKGSDDFSPPRKNRKPDDDYSPPRKNRRPDDDVSPPRKNRRPNDDYSPPRKTVSDLSPMRKNRRGDLSPLRRSRKDDDYSPPRKNKRIDDSSPPRKNRGDNEYSPARKNKREVDSSPSRKSRKDNDFSPQRKNKGDNGSSSPRKSRWNDDSSSSGTSRKDDSSGPKRSRWNDDDSSPPRKNKRPDDSSRRRDRSREDFSPSGRNKDPVLHKNRSRSKYDSSPKKHRNNESHFNIKMEGNKTPDGSSGLSRERLEDASSKSSDEKRPKKMERTLDGKRAGLQDAQQLIEETRNLKTREEQLFKSLSTDISGRNADTVHRERKTGKIRNLEEEQERQQKKREEEEKNKEKYERWGRGLAQVESREQQLKEQLYEMSKPLARYADDEDLERYLKEQEREGDPMLAYIRKKKKKKAAEAGEVTKPQFEGEFMPNRYGIRPGHRWDGVDRSNGYEKKWFEVQNEKRAQQDESYKWSTEDM